MYKHEKFMEAINHAKQNCDIKGVKEILKKLENNYEEYKKEMDAYLVKENPLLESCDNVQFEYFKKSELYKKILIGLVIVGIVSWEINVLHYYSSFVWLAVFPCLVIFLFNMFKYKSTSKKYRDKKAEVSKGASIINEKYLNENRYLYEQIDVLYLSSLDPVQREMVLLRRENKRIQEQNLQIQREYQSAMKEQQKIQETLLEEQKKSREVQEELLRIEKERENRKYY